MLVKGTLDITMCFDHWQHDKRSIYDKNSVEGAGFAWQYLYRNISHPYIFREMKIPCGIFHLLPCTLIIGSTVRVVSTINGSHVVTRGLHDDICVAMFHILHLSLYTTHHINLINGDGFVKLPLSNSSIIAVYILAGVDIASILLSHRSTKITLCPAQY